MEHGAKRRVPRDVLTSLESDFVKQLVAHHGLA